MHFFYTIAASIGVSTNLWKFCDCAVTVLSGILYYQTIWEKNI